MLRGLTPELAIRKVQVDAEVSERVAEWKAVREVDDDVLIDEMRNGTEEDFLDRIRTEARDQHREKERCSGAADAFLAGEEAIIDGWHSEPSTDADGNLVLQLGPVADDGELLPVTHERTFEGATFTHLANFLRKFRSDTAYRDEFKRTLASSN